jgi:hypothetical protein
MAELDDENTPLPVEEPLPPTPVEPSSEEPILLRRTFSSPPQALHPVPYL